MTEPDLSSSVNKSVAIGTRLSLSLVDHVLQSGEPYPLWGVWLNYTCRF